MKSESEYSDEVGGGGDAVQDAKLDVERFHILGSFGMIICLAFVLFQLLALVHNLARHGAHYKIVHALGDHNGEQRIGLQHIGFSGTVQPVEYVGMVSDPELEQPACKSDGDGKVDGKGLVLQRVELVLG